MLNKINASSFMSSATGDQPSEQSVIRTVNFDRYVIDLELTTDGKFLGIYSIKVQKSFIDSIGSNQISDVHDVDEYYNED